MFILSRKSQSGALISRMLGAYFSLEKNENFDRDNKFDVIGYIVYSDEYNSECRIPVCDSSDYKIVLKDGTVYMCEAFIKSFFK